jgi:ABC-2 type transport system ATP-binding protein
MTTAALEIRGLHKTYRNGFEALKGIDLTVEPGSFFALLGPNGAGKSTTIGIITSLVNKTSGQVRVFGHDLDREVQDVKRSIGLVPQEFNFNAFEPVGEIVVNQAGYYGIPRHEAWRRARHYLGELGLWDKRREMARTLSGGMKRRLMIARALVHEPRLLILDEPTAGVDIELRRSMWDFLRLINAEGRSIILTTHYLEEAEQLCRNIAIIDQGRIVADTTMKNLLARLDIETVVLDLLAPPERLPTHDRIVLRGIDELTLEADIHRGESLNTLFHLLDKASIRVQSMRNKTNRLEELFIRMTQAPHSLGHDMQTSQ